MRQKDNAIRPSMNRISPFHHALFAAALICAALNFVAFYPGILHHDAWAYFDGAQKHALDNWQPPLLGYLWMPLQKIYYGPQPMLALFLAAYWSGFVLIARSFEAESRALAGWTFATALFPMALNFNGVLVKDIGMAVCLLAAAGIAAALVQGAIRKRAVTIALMWLLLIAGGFMRANALFGFPPLIGLMALATSKRWAAIHWLKRAIAVCLLALLFIPGHLIADRYVFNVKNVNPISPLQVFDIGGITYFSNRDGFGGSFGPDFVAKNRGCYTPRAWDVYGWGACEEVYEGLKPRFGGDLTKMWIEAIAVHPLAYVEHRIAHLNRFLQFICRDCEERVFTGMQSTNQHIFTFTPTFLYEAIDWFAEAWSGSPFGQPYVWLLVCLAWSAAAFAIPGETTRHVTLMIALSGAMYALAYAVVGIASDYRYIYWTMLCALTTTPVIVARVLLRRDAPMRLRAGPVAAIAGVIVLREIIVRILL